MISWDERYTMEGYAYGTEPNRWLVECAPGIRAGGSVLCLGEGEGRNGVWLARQGFAVEAVDASTVGLGKARRLADSYGVPLRTTVADLRDFVPDAGSHDAVVLVYLHLPPGLREVVHARAAAALTPGGLLVLEGFTPRQQAFSSGGPREAALLFEPATLRDDFPGITWEVMEEREVDLDEGPFHRGRAAVVRARGRRAG